LRASVGSTEASASLLARVGVVGPKRANAGKESPAKDNESNWLPARAGSFSLYIRACWREEAILDGSRQPPKFEKLK
jgi:hypothetical protein